MAKSNDKVVSFMKSTLQNETFSHEVRYSYIRIDFQEDNELHPLYLANPEAEIAILTRKARIVLLRSCCECVTRGCLFLVIHTRSWCRKWGPSSLRGRTQRGVKQRH